MMGLRMSASSTLTAFTPYLPQPPDKKVAGRNYSRRAGQQQHSGSVQCGHSLAEGLCMHSEGRHPQSAHFISMPHDTHADHKWILRRGVQRLHFPFDRWRS
jgi:hypothetical protein